MDWLVPVSDRYDRSKLDVYLIPGFLTEKPDIPYGSTTIKALSKRTPWARRFIPLLPEIPANFFLVNWASGRIRAILRSVAIYLGLIGPSLILGTVGIILWRWRRALSYADTIGKVEISRYLTESERPYLLIGHSLGARIALRICEKAGLSRAPRLPRAIALAPAISASEINWQGFERYRPDELEVLFSRGDKILQVLFPAVQTSLKSAIGLVGVPKAHEDKIRCVDVTRRESEYRKRRGHRHYEKDLLFLLARKTQLWEEMLPGTRQILLDAIPIV